MWICQVKNKLDICLILWSRCRVFILILHLHIFLTSNQEEPATTKQECRGTKTSFGNFNQLWCRWCAFFLILHLYILWRFEKEKTRKCYRVFWCTETLGVFFKYSNQLFNKHWKQTSYYEAEVGWDKEFSDITHQLRHLLDFLLKLHLHTLYIKLNKELSSSEFLLQEQIQIRRRAV